MRVAIVNDLRLATEVLRRIVLSTGEHQIAWTAADGHEAVRRCREDTPDVVLMDLVMPEMNGADATKQIMRESPCPILVVTATVSGNYALVCEALGHGAYDAICTPSAGDASQSKGPAELLSKLGSVQRITRHLGIAEPDSDAGVEVDTSAALGAAAVPLVAIGASTGGPRALESLLSQWNADSPACGIIVQHIGVEFAASLVRWLDERCPVSVRSARPGDHPEPRTILVAATADHLVMNGNRTFRYVEEPRETPYRPSVDAFFTSLASHWPQPGLAALLTGIGRDGAQGLLELRQCGWHTIAQDEASSVVYGMPREAARIGAAKEILAIDKIAAAISAWVGRNAAG